MASGQFTFKSVSALATGEKKGSGAYGAVYKVTVDGVPCIAKRLHDILVDPEVPRKQRGFIQQKFHDECVLLSQLRHPNVVHFVGVHYGSNQDDISLIMECLDTDLAKCLETQPNIPLEVKLTILLDVSYGLLYLHTHSPQIIHRDLTAANILLTRDKRAKIADLGVSKLLDPHTQAAMMQTKAPGTIYYMPPEALKENPVYDEKLDIFSFGHLALYVINQVFPQVFEVSITPVMLREKTLQIQKRRKAIDEMGRNHCLHNVVMKCLQDDPQKRPATFKLNEMLNHLCMKYPREHQRVTELSSVKDWKVVAIAAENDCLKEEVLQYKKQVDQYREEVGALEQSIQRQIQLNQKFVQETEEWQARAAEWKTAVQMEEQKERIRKERRKTADLKWGNNQDTEHQLCAAYLTVPLTTSPQLITTQKWMKWHVYMQNNDEGNVRGWKEDPGQQGHWNITQIGSTNKYLLSPKEWPNWYMYMQDNSKGNVRGWQGDPGPQGHWMITQKGTVIVGDQSLSTYVFNTEQWPNWYMYMQDNSKGNVRGWEGDPGIQGYFIMKKAP